MVVVEASSTELEELMLSPTSPIETDGIVMEDPPRYISSPVSSHPFTKTTSLRKKQQHVNNEHYAQHELQDRNLSASSNSSTSAATETATATNTTNASTTTSNTNDAASTWGYNSFELNEDFNQQHYSYGLEMLRIPHVWKDYKTKGDNVTVCIVDTGLDVTHEEFRDLYYNDDGHRLIGWSPFDANGNLNNQPTSSTNDDPNALPFWAADGNGHGTHVAGILAAQDANRVGFVGVAPNINIVIVRIFRDSGRFYSSDLVEAFLRCAAFEKTTVSPSGEVTKVPAVDFINLSLGGPKYQPAEHAIINCLSESAGIGFMAAAGNTGRQSVDYPAGYDAVMSVAAVDPNGALASFSTRNQHVDVAAPGVEIWSTFPAADEYVAPAGSGSGGDSTETASLPDEGSNSTSASDVCVQCKKSKTEFLSRGYGSTSGTSMALPYVTGIAALAKSAYPQASHQMIFDAIASTATDLGVPGKDERFGHGLVDGMRAMDEVKRRLSPSSDASSACTMDEFRFDMVIYGESRSILNVKWELEKMTNGGGADSLPTYDSDTIATIGVENDYTEYSQSVHVECLKRKDECYKFTLIDAHKVVGYSVQIDGQQYSKAFYQPQLSDDEIIFGDGCHLSIVTRSDLSIAEIGKDDAQPTALLSSATSDPPTLSPVEFFNTGSITSSITHLDDILQQCDIHLGLLPATQVPTMSPTATDDDEMNPPPSSQDDASSSKNGSSKSSVLERSNWVIGSVVVGIVSLLFLMMTALYIIRRRKRRSSLQQREESAVAEEEQPKETEENPSGVSDNDDNEERSDKETA